MKPVWVTMPLPRCMDRWQALVGKYTLKEPVYHNSVCHCVQIPPGWVVLKDPQDRKNIWIMYDENNNRVAMIFLTKKVGFTVLEPPDEKKNARRKDKDSL